MTILFSVSYDRSFEVPEGAYRGHKIEVVARPADWGLSGLRKKLFHLQSAWDVARRARQFEALVICTVSIETFFIGLLKRWLCPRTRVVCADILIPRHQSNDRYLGKWLRQLNGIVVIRTGDTATLAKRFGFPASKCHFALFPAASLPQVEGSGDYLYAAGSAHRDWPTLLSALENTPHKAILGPPSPLDVPASLKDQVEVRAGLSPDEGRAFMERAGGRDAIFGHAFTFRPAGFA